MVTIAVRRLHQQYVGAAERLRRQQQRVAEAPEISAGGQSVAVLQGQVGPGRAEDVSTVVQA
ncbi:hypothetical protein [Streptomyces sp. LN590]|uniref:hypothetical protein n=1 Tax=Streptomyces sp. LN590 TaxID=3112980 RepID=UPI0037216557